MNAPATPRDFPDWLGPMLVKELRQGLKTRVFVISFLLLQAVFVSVIIYHALLFRRNGESFDASGLSGIFWVLIGLQLVIVTPCRAFNELAGERKANTLELTFMTGLTPWGIVVGKWASLLFQAVLFLLAVFPYAILRYYFGGVNLVEDLIAISALLMLCAIFSAIAIAISALPLFVRIIAMVLAFFFSTSLIPGLFAAMIFGRSGFAGVFSLPDANWPLLWFDAAVLCVGALEIGAAAIAPPAENHAARERLISFAALLPFPLLLLQKGHGNAMMGQLIFFEFVTGFTAWHQLADAPSQLRRHFEPFAKFGELGYLVGAFFQPGWPSAALYLLAVVTVALAGFWKSVSGSLSGAHEATKFGSALLIGAAAQLTAPLLWRVLRRKARWPLLEYVIFQIIFGVAAVFLLSLKPDSFHYGRNPLWAMFPPLGMWLMLDNGFDPAVAAGTEPWLTLSLVSFVGYFLCLEAFAAGYWRRVRNMFREIRRERKPVGALEMDATAG